MSSNYCGRFAPSPTGPLHFGSLVAAIASYCQARVNQGKWLVRIEDIDPPREVAGASEAILHTLESFGLEWDEEVIYQSRRQDYYLAALDELRQQQRLYQCNCSRKTIAEHSLNGVYPGTCRGGPAGTNSIYSVRLLVEPHTLKLTDRIQGPLSYQMEVDIGDFVLQRADRLFAYQLTVALDDVLQGVTEVVRGADLIDSTPRQMYLQELLGYSSPVYAHHPVVLNQEGQKLSKQNLAPAIKVDTALSLTHQALSFLGQDPPQLAEFTAQRDLLNWACQNWELEKIPKKLAFSTEEINRNADTGFAGSKITD